MDYVVKRCFMDEYFEQISLLLEEALNEELKSALDYLRDSVHILGVNTKDIRDEYLEHVKDELEHYHILLTYCHNRGIMVNHNTNLEFVYKQDEISDPSESLKNNEVSELDAANRYCKMSQLALEYGDIEGYKIFSRLMEVEYDHFDDLTDFTGHTRHNHTPNDTVIADKDNKPSVISDVDVINDNKSVESVGSSKVDNDPSNQNYSKVFTQDELEY